MNEKGLVSAKVADILDVRGMHPNVLAVAVVVVVRRLTEQGNVRRRRRHQDDV